MLPTAPSHQPLARGVRGHGPEPPFLLQSCSMVAHCSDFFQVWASSSFLVLTASSNKLMLSWKPQIKGEKSAPGTAPALLHHSHHARAATPLLPPACRPPPAPKSFSSLRREAAAQPSSQQGANFSKPGAPESAVPGPKPDLQPPRVSPAAPHMLGPRRPRGLWHTHGSFCWHAAPHGKVPGRRCEPGAGAGAQTPVPG